eukprot:TRINITY_DN78132_c0_g1_i1.p1 TRINITY_DN78132_c0_g1~~TRINITY_DN78132_c0_g1_i1.p1  ORF type:complete len:482 (+),score=87.97 TRINITY_DN78132_c0_g1_i1:1163-2608(+)
MATPSHSRHSSRSRHPIQIVSTDQGPRVGPYIFGKTLGTGSTGKVKLAKNTDTDEIVAIKIVRKDYLENKPSLKKKMRREISVLKVLHHPNLMSLIDVFEIETHLFLVMEFVDGLELFEYLVRRGALQIPEALNFFQQIICGLEYCHRRLICHRDLKPENLLLDRNFVIKIADFGMTSLSPPDSLLETSCGSPHYCDPMVVSGDKYDGLKADIWSCGVILYAMVTGRLPFDDDNIQRLLQKVQAGQYHLPSNLPPDLRDLIKSMLTVAPEERITLEGIKQHPWFTSIPPRHYVEDNFVPPSEPILDPDPMILRSLIDLGWGDAQLIRTELARPGPSMEKAFYEQLEKHPMFHRSTLEPPSPPPENEETNPIPSSEPPTKADEDKELEERLARVSVQDGERKEGQLVRQSSFRQGAENGAQAEENDAKAEEALQNVNSTHHKSWFDSVRNYLTGQAEGEKSEQENGKTEDNDDEQNSQSERK